MKNDTRNKKGHSDDDDEDGRWTTHLSRPPYHKAGYEATSDRVLFDVVKAHTSIGARTAGATR